MKNKCSLQPQGLKNKGEWWYYENRGSIEVFIDCAVMQACMREGHGYNFRIPRRMLEQSLKRMKATRP